MYYFLAIVSDKNLKRGVIIPSYILCQSHGTKTTRSQWRINRIDSGLNMNKVLATTLYGNEHMIDFMSHYRTRDHMHSPGTGRKHKNSLKYYPTGALFWFECNQYGEPLGTYLFIKRVPDKSYTSDSDAGLKRLREEESMSKRINISLAREPTLFKDVYSCVKPVLYQSDAISNTKKHKKDKINVKEIKK